MAYGYKLEDLLNILHGRSPAKADALAVNRRHVEDGLLSVGLKIHYTGAYLRFHPLIERLMGPTDPLPNAYKQAGASLCLVLHPMGNAHAAITLVETIEHFLGFSLFESPDTQLQVCSPGRLSARPAALLAIAFYLGSDMLRRYAIGDLETTFTNRTDYPRARRLILWDADGEFDRNFEWWKRSSERPDIKSMLPFNNGRSDVLIGRNSTKKDILNINLIATLLVHAEHNGYWGDLGREFMEDMEELLDRHLLSGILEAPWVRTDDVASDDDRLFFPALQELTAYALEESVRIKVKEPGRFFRRWRHIPARGSRGILEEMQAILHKYRKELARQAHLFRNKHEGEGT